MLNRLPSAGKLLRMNRRQRKKLRVGEFQERVFEVRMRFHNPMDDAAHDDFLDGFIALIESRHLAVGGLGGQLPLMETDGIVSAWGRGSPTEEDRQAVLDWLRRHPRVAGAEAGDFMDGWYGWDDAP
ncbi:YggL family protein [Methylococcus mesophilus]|uniref:YggL family protein n=1 Tax=Methylococcus mesophilus TaxID=2993564 RepID=UPI00224AB06F|nr:YggL family protein [Methylococcus mesophilus]UZR28133.1 YggL family protein [Methylococcus mesophilus]